MLPVSKFDYLQVLVFQQSWPLSIATPLLLLLVSVLLQWKLPQSAAPNSKKIQSRLLKEFWEFMGDLKNQKGLQWEIICKVEEVMNGQPALVCIVSFYLRLCNDKKTLLDTKRLTTEERQNAAKTWEINQKSDIKIKEQKNCLHFHHLSPLLVSPPSSSFPSPTISMPWTVPQCEL